VTNYHVVANTKDIQVQLSDKKQYPAKIIGLDKKTDLALIKIQVKEDLPEVTLGNSEELEIGNWVVAIGNAFGLSHTVTAGIVSAKGRMINLGPYDDFIQTDASINPGNSGGPLFNLNGEVVGINSAIVASGQGIGFAIPINMAKNLIPQLKTHGKVVRGWLGVLVQKVSPELAGAFKLKNPEGALVAQVMEGSPAQKAGIIQGDIILKFSGHKIVEMTDLPRLVANTPVGKKVPIDIYRNNKNKQIMITIEKLEDESEVLALPKPEEMEKNDVYGLYLDDLTSDISRQLKMKNSKGVLVKEIEPNSPASESEFRRGDVITEINQIPIGNLNELKKVVEKNAKKDVLLMLVLRDGIAYYVTLKKKG
jgi:serine protease Do